MAEATKHHMDRTGVALTPGDHADLTSANKSGCLSRTLSNLTNARGGLVLPFSYREKAFTPPPKISAASRWSRLSFLRTLAMNSGLMIDATIDTVFIPELI
jgi:hypothetical protein